MNHFEYKNGALCCAVASGPEVTARLAADRAYVDALRRGEEPVDGRLETDWMSGPHRSNVEQIGDG